MPHASERHLPALRYRRGAWAFAAMVACGVAALPVPAAAKKHAKPAPSPNEDADEEIETIDPAPAKKAAPAGAAPAGGDDVEQIETVDTDGGGGDGGGDSTPEEDWYGDAYPQFSRILDHYTGRTARKGDFETLIGHRNWEGLLRAPLRDFFGFDGYGLKIDLGLRYGITDRLEIGVLRQNRTFEKYTTWEFDARFQLLTQAANKLDVSVRLGLDLFSHPDKYAAGVFAQLLISRVIWNRVLFGGGVLYSGSSSGQNKRNSDASTSFALMVQLDVRLVDWVSLALEVTPGIAGYEQAYPCITFGPRFITNRHTFSVFISNTQYVTADGIVANTYRSSYKDWLLGFMITREI